MRSLLLSERRDLIALAAVLTTHRLYELGFSQSLDRRRLDCATGREHAGEQGCDGGHHKHDAVHASKGSTVLPYRLNTMYDPSHPNSVAEHHADHTCDERQQQRLDGQ